MTFDNNGLASRKLYFPLDEDMVIDAADNADGAITKVTADFFPEDPDEKIDVVFNLSFNEFTAIASSVDIGRDIGYGEQSALVWWTWIRSLIGIGGVPVSCEDIADCIETDIDVQNAITSNPDISLQLMMNNANSGIGDIPAIDSETSTVMNTPQAIGTAKDEEIKELENCDLDKLWAGIRDGIVQRLDDNARSVLEWLVAKADVAERATALIGAIPIFGSMAKSILDQMVELAPDMLNLYESYSSIANMDEIACEIFGLVCAECRYPTYQEVFSYYASAGITGMDDLDDIAIAVATDLFFGSTELAAIAFYHTLVAYELLILAMGSKFYGFSGSNAVFQMASLGEDFANDNWMLLCESCNEDYQLWTWDFTTQGIGEFYPDTAQNTSKALFVPGVGWRAVNHSTGRRFDVAMPFNPAWEIRAVAYNVEGAADTGHNWVRRPTWGSTTGQTNSSAGSLGTEWSYYYDGYASLTGYNEVVFFAQFAGGANAVLTKVSILFNTGHSPSPTMPTTDLTPYS